MRVLHFLVVGMWTGVVATEVILEWSCREGASARTAAVVHYWLDLLVEAPLVLAVAASGAYLLVGAWPPGPVLAWKLALSAVPIISCCWSIMLVVRRYGRRHEPEALATGRRRVLLSALAVGPGVLALYLGLRLHGLT
jgi:hypothetical protein